MRALALAGMAWSVLAVIVENVDYFSIVDKYGFPTAVSVGIFIYFSRQLRQANRDVDSYRAEILEEQREQTKYLRNLLNETKLASACKYAEIHGKK